MVGCSSHCETGDCDRMASARLSSVLALAIAAARRPTQGERGGSNSHPPHSGWLLPTVFSSMANTREYRICTRESTNREISGVLLLALSRPRSSACCCRRSSGRSSRLDCCRHRGKNQRQRKDSAGIRRHRCRTGWSDSSALVATHTCVLRCSYYRCCRGKKNHRHRCTTEWGDSSARSARHMCGFRRSCHRRCTTGQGDSSAQAVSHTCGFRRSCHRRCTTG
jgi:hypothetical protein